MSHQRGGCADSKASLDLFVTCRIGLENTECSSPSVCRHGGFLSIPAHPQSPAFLDSHKKPIYYSDFNTFTKFLIDKIGLDHQQFSTHSYRRGGATHAFSKNIPSELIKLHGDWKSDAYLIYLEYSFEQRLSISQIMSSKLS